MQLQIKLQSYMMEFGPGLHPKLKFFDFFLFTQHLNLTISPLVQHSAVCGTLNFYDKSYDRVSTKFEKPLQQYDRCFVNLTSSADPVLQKYAQEAEGPVVLATDSILSTLMCAPRSVYSWDIVFTKSGDKIFIDKRDGSNIGECLL
jgi:translation initiation factor 3 subunit D